MNEIDPKPDGRGRRIGVAVARFNAEVTEMLVAGCRESLRDAGVGESDIELVRVPGAWELPLACQHMIATGRFDAVIALGAVVRGETAHFEFISGECARGLMQLAADTGMPVAFGVLTPENGDQARERADPERGNKGREAALAALEMIDLADRVGAGERDGP
ncbi:MAG: 6,7-dimethyl-8-ribityllumazine synthase [Wenzhouxiangellaceae bacterium]|nr:6,7-dimethyl-8-ribityllumazine synthase [Wenzhouxiangellaceae bacterium]MBS3822427.1 6,7-dimethyl-8-ribityllumazine synthase [Wenzhouxiangellaceae bacterium]